MSLYGLIDYGDRVKEPVEKKTQTVFVVIERDHDFREESLDKIFESKNDAQNYIEYKKNKVKHIKYRISEVEMIKEGKSVYNVGE